MRKREDAYCRCHRPIKPSILPPSPEKQLDGNGKTIAVLCKRCTRLISCRCPTCGDWVTPMFDHVISEVCKPPETPRAKRTESNWLPGIPMPATRKP